SRDDLAGSGALDRVAGSHQALGGGLDLIRTWELDRPFEQARITLARGALRGRPGVHPEVVVVSAGGEQERAGVAPDDLVEPERVVVEARRGPEVAHVQVHVPDDRTVGEAGPGKIAGRRQ